MTAPLESRRSPYQGLTPFHERDTAYFFGREKDARLIAADLFASPVTVLYGASGVGKSSVLRAGVVPLLRPRADMLIVVFAAWQSDPLSGLKEAVAKAIFETVSPEHPDYERYRESVSRLEQRPLAEYLAQCAALVKRRLMLMLDQFEEYSLYHPEDDDFGRQFPPATAIGDLSVSFLLSMRDDSVTRLDRFEGRIPGLFDNYRRVDHLDREAGRAAIERPVAKYNAEHSDAEPIDVDPLLADLVLDSVATGRLPDATSGHGTSLGRQAMADGRRIEAPYLQLVMSRLWEKERGEQSKVLHAETLSQLGGAEQIVRTHLTTVMSQLTDEQQEIAARVFQLLVTPSGTKIAHSVHDLAATAAVDRHELQEIMVALSAGTDRILRPVAALPENPGEPRYEIFHDRLASAVLEWRILYLKDREVAEAKREEVGRRRQQPVEFHRRPSSGSRSADVSKTPPYTTIADLLMRRKLVVVLGAGVSTAARPAGMSWSPDSSFAPTSWELIQLLASDVGYPPEDLPAASLSEIASYVAVLLGTRLLDERLSGVFDRVTRTAPIHELLAMLGTQFPLVVVTTTVDALMERAFEAHGTAYQVVVNGCSGEDLIVRMADGEVTQVSPRELSHLDDNVSCIYKVFGSVGLKTRGRRFIITEEDEMTLFSEFSAGRLPPRALAEALTERHMLILGMSLRSWTQRLLISRVFSKLSSRQRTRGWAVVQGVSTVNLSRWKAAGIEVFDQDVRDFTAGLQPLLRGPA